ncbi:MAG: family 20 glycosylhydrolase [candidate division KSB1 bacterium]|nr:family 20 glycosylhydrolase [candidate division KSB1 bacterium]
MVVQIEGLYYETDHHDAFNHNCCCLGHGRSAGSGADQDSIGEYRLNTTFKIAVQGVPEGRLHAYATRTLHRLSGRTGLFFEQQVVSAGDTAGAQMTVTVERRADLGPDMDESYSLVIRSSGIQLNAATDVGAMRGLETVLQLLSADEKGYYFSALVVEDQPRFTWRGLLIDVSRHFQPVGVLKRNIDAMAAVKMNVLHLHLTDDQGFRVECKSFPKLHELGSDGLYYSQEQIKDIIRYAADRGIRVVPEFDMPGHATSWFVGYPEYASAPGPYSIEREWGIMDPVFNPAEDNTFEFLRAFYQEMCALFPDESMHIGGDENNGVHWDANKEIQAFKQEKGFADNHQLQNYFVSRVHDILKDYGKIMVGWEEIMHPDSPKNIIIQSWRGKNTLMDAARNGYRVILSKGYYIDLMKSAEHHYLNDPVTKEMRLTREEQERIIGGEATMWGEFVTPELIDSRIWPRTAAIAERLWALSEVNDVGYVPASGDCQCADGGTGTAPQNLSAHDAAASDSRTTDRRPAHAGRGGAAFAELHTQFQTRFLSAFSYTRVMDAARPDPPQARRFEILVRALLYDKEQSESAARQLNAVFQQWIDHQPQLQTVIDRSPILGEIRTLSVRLAKLGRAGQILLRCQKEGHAPDTSERVFIQDTLKAAEKSAAQVKFAVLPAMQMLVKAVMGLPQPAEGR